MTPLGLTADTVARALHLPRSRIERIIEQEIGISADTALRLARYFRTSHMFWLNLQIGSRAKRRWRRSAPS